MIYLSIKIGKVLDYYLKGVHLSRQKFIRSFIFALIYKSNVKFSEIAKVLNDEVDADSNKRRIQRFFADYVLDYKRIGYMLMSFVSQRKLKLSLDRTNWQFAGENFNILTLTVCYEGIGIPICFEMLDKKGNSNQSERIDLLSQFIEWFGAKRIGLLLADREFIGQEWLNYLSKENIRYCIRVRNNTRIEMGGIDYSAQDLLACYARKTFEKVKVMNQTLHVSLKRLPLSKTGKEDHLVLITNGFVKQALKLYRERWTIEVFFQSLKGRGFDLEASHLEQAQRMKKLFALCCIAFVICLNLGVHQHQNVKTIPSFNHSYKAYSFFRLGKDLLEKAIRLFYKDDRLVEQVFRPIRVLLCRIEANFNLHSSFVT